jgi:hypothetical protein
VSIQAGDATPRVTIDATDLVRRVAAGESDDYGFLLRPLDEGRLGFGDAEMTVLGAIDGGTLHVTYRNLPSSGLPDGVLARWRPREGGR